MKYKTLVLILIIVLVGVFLSYQDKDMYSGYFELEQADGTYTANPMKMNLVLRSEVPPTVRAELNKYNSSSKQRIQIPIPKEFDSRTKWPGLITGPLDQGKCGSCWAFAICTSSSDRLRITYPKNKNFQQITSYRGYNGTLFREMVNLNPYEMAGCDLCKTSPIQNTLQKNHLCGQGGSKSAACLGEVLQVAMQYLHKNGATIVSCSPQHNQCIKDKSKCFYDCIGASKICTVYKPLTIHPVNEDFAEENVENLDRSKVAQIEILTDGPIVVGYEVWQSFMDFFVDPKNIKKVYTKKIKDNADPQKEKKIGGHAVVIIGWGTDENGVDYWLIRNSWGPTWGDHGFFRLERGINFLGIGNDMWVSHWHWRKEDKI